MADTIFVVAEQREGKLNRVSFETIAGAQAISKETGWPVEVVVAGNDSLDAVAAELAAKNVARVYALEAPALAAYTSDAYVFALKCFLRRPSSRSWCSFRTPTRCATLPHAWRSRWTVPLSPTRSATSTKMASCCLRGRCFKENLRRMFPSPGMDRGWLRFRLEPFAAIRRSPGLRPSKM